LKRYLHLTLPFFERIVSRDEYFLRVLKSIEICFVRGLIVFTIFGSLFVEEIKNSMLLLTLTYCENPFGKLVPIFR
jgi:hypothetical protein